MKKFFKSVALMLVLCMTLAFAPACGEKPSAAGTVSGDYKPVTAKAEQTKIEEAINMFVATPYETLDGEKGKLTEEKDNLKITFKRREITDIIGDTLTNNEVAEYFYYCLQRTDMLEEWRRMYSEVGSDDEAGNA